MQTVSLAKYRKGFVAFTVYGVDTEEPAPGEAGTPPRRSPRLRTQRNLSRLGTGHPGAHLPSQGARTHSHGAKREAEMDATVKQPLGRGGRVR